MFKKFLKISQLQIEGLENPIQNTELIKKNLLKTITFNPDIISTPECSNIITNDKKHLIENVTFQIQISLLMLLQLSDNKSASNQTHITHHHIVHTCFELETSLQIQNDIATTTQRMACQMICVKTDCVCHALAS